MFLKNSLSGKLEEFIPINSEDIRMYVCGPTIYNSPHIGNTRSIIVFDLLYRILKFLYPKVTYVRNITDVDDKIIKKARESHESIDNLTSRVLKDFNNDIEMLDILHPTFEPKATEHIKDMIDMIQVLIAKGYAYIANDHVLFRIEKDFDYGCLSKRKLQDMVPGKRIDPAPYKENPLDFVLWKPSSNNVGWDSPWGFGRPGWHIECSAMSNKYLGSHFDIHGGGQDLIFPHHENEIAQTRGFSGCNIMANYWVHNGMLTINGLKMSKSKGNVFYLKNVLQKYSPAIIRYFFYASHYSKQCNWSDENLRSAENNIRNLSIAIDGIDEIKQTITENFDKVKDIFKNRNEFIDKEFLSALENDMNTPLALNRLNELSKMILKETSQNKRLELKYILYQSAKLIGIHLQQNQVSTLLPENEINILIEQRKIAKQNKNFKLADDIRNALLAQNIILEDSKSGTTWKFKS